MADAGPTALVPAVRAALRELADPERAAGMRAYLKTAEPCLGVRLPEVRRLTRAAAAAHPPASVDEVRAAAGRLWREAAYREERYAAQALTGLPAARGDLRLLPLLEEMITTGAWWDLVDGTQARVAELLRADPAAMEPVVRGWARSPDRWLRRSAVIAQLGRKEHTDTALLTDVVLANADDPDFFLRKAIGWALREYAKVAPGWVAAFVRDHPLSPLSRREATKHLRR
ncbi:DNA alkylation repair protein [Blastococcus tunisiensis]|uniref:3-methyladenine DNA glycosylase AlkD n=1 Tax=Blastococcus tunisiensis TaxID=1798228 RepID=A0A1I2I1B6_9ACTN|nr:DNA alkylation repair protein [Blastococcus sp. DSM 46838]SFF35430.1 3-methyladenine DNA glycosylase AlkD [Blastococcus sp. DSM 46838]